MATPRVIDLSHHNAIPKDLTAAKAAGIIGCIHKVTEGTSHIDSKVDARYYLAQQAGMAWGIYHFLRPGSMQAQAEHFINTARQLGVMDDNTLFVADHEDAGVSYNSLLEFLGHVERLTGRSPAIYSGHVLKDQCEIYPDAYRLWLCHYTTGTPTLPAGCEAYWLWQYTDEGSIAGVTPPTDLNHFEGDDDEFLSGWAGWPEGAQPEPEPGPEPEPEPGEQVVRVLVHAPPGVRVEVTIAEVDDVETLAR